MTLQEIFNEALLGLPVSFHCDPATAASLRVGMVKKYSLYKKRMGKEIKMIKESPDVESYYSEHYIKCSYDVTTNTITFNLENVRNKYRDYSVTRKPLESF